MFCCVSECITTVVAYDPDIKDRNADQNITYNIVKVEQQPLIDIDKSGCLKLKKPLDRDAPNGYPTWTVIIIIALAIINTRIYKLRLKSHILFTYID